VKLKFDKSGRSEGVANVVFKSLELAEQAKREFNGQPLDGLIIQVDLVREWKLKTKNPPKVVKQGSVFDRLAPKIEDRLGKKIGDRLGARLDDRLGPKLEDRLGKKKAIKKNKNKGNKMDTDEPKNAERIVKSYADTDIVIDDGALI
jgi:RNA recognition motif-containing protein